MATAAPITPLGGFNTAFAAYSAALCLRTIACGDAETERAEDAIDPLFDAVMSHPARDLSSIISKCSALFTEFELVPADLVEAIMFDLIALERAQ